MRKLKAGLLTAGGVAIGVLTARTVRRRLSDSQDEAADPGERAVDEASTAVEHASHAVTHARAAGENAVEYARQGMEESTGEITSEEAEATAAQPVRRLRRVGNGWIRR